MTSEQNLETIIYSLKEAELPEIKVIKLKSTIKNKRKSMM